MSTTFKWTPSIKVRRTKRFLLKMPELYYRTYMCVGDNLHTKRNSVNIMPWDVIFPEYFNKNIFHIRCTEK